MESNNRFKNFIVGGAIVNFVVATWYVALSIEDMLVRAIVLLILTLLTLVVAAAILYGPNQKQG